MARFFGRVVMRKRSKVAARIKRRGFGTGDRVQLGGVRFSGGEETVRISKGKRGFTVPIQEFTSRKAGPRIRRRIRRL